MPCTECAALAWERDRLWRVYSHAITILGSCVPTDAEEQIRLQGVVEESRIAFNQAATALYQHQDDSHTVPD
jgi:hypothetical protein